MALCFPVILGLVGGSNFLSGIFFSPSLVRRAWGFTSQPRPRSIVSSLIVLMSTKIGHGFSVVVTYFRIFDFCSLLLCPSLFSFHCLFFSSFHFLFFFIFSSLFFSSSLLSSSPPLFLLSASLSFFFWYNGPLCFDCFKSKDMNLGPPTEILY